MGKKLKEYQKEQFLKALEESKKHPLVGKQGIIGKDFENIVIDVNAQKTEYTTGTPGAHSGSNKMSPKTRQMETTGLPNGNKMTTIKNRENEKSYIISTKRRRGRRLNIPSLVMRIADEIGADPREMCIWGALNWRMHTLGKK